MGATDGVRVRFRLGLRYGSVTVWVRLIVSRVGTFEQLSDYTEIF